MADENVTNDLALFLAVKADEDEKAKLIIEEHGGGVFSNITNDYNWTALHHAAYYGDIGR